MASERFGGFFVPQRQEVPPSQSIELNKAPRDERIIVVSDLHGAKPEVVARLTDLVKDPPSVVILAGDVAGTEDLEVLQGLYYNHLTNHTRNEVLKSEITDANLLVYGGTKPPYEGFTVRKGFVELRTKELQLQGISSEAIQAYLQMLTDEDIAKEVRRYGEFIHYGHYASNLPDTAKKKLADGIRENARKIAEPLKKLQAAGTFVAINEGNWDPSPPIAFKPGVPTAERLNPSDQPFSTQEFFESEKIPYFTGMTFFESETAAFVLLPFDQLIRFGTMTQEDVNKFSDNIAQKVKKARKDGKQIIVVQHGEAQWKPHNLTNPNSTPSKGEHEQILDGFAKVTRYIQPDEILHGHFHAPYVDEDGKEQPIDTKYGLRVLTAGVPVLIEKAGEIQAGDAVVSYMPLQRFAEIRIPRNKDDRKLRQFGGKREPARVT